MADRVISIRKTILVLVLYTFTGLDTVLAESQTLQQDKPAAETWQLSAKHEGFNIALTAITPDRIRAFFTGRDFPPKMIKAIASYCVIGTRIKNTGSQPFSYDLRKWRYQTADGKLHKLKIKADWIKEWREQGIKFAYSQLAGNPTFLPGDWISSMTTYRLPHGASFDLHYQWSIDGKDNTGIIKGVKCADD